MQLKQVKSFQRFEIIPSGDLQGHKQQGTSQPGQKGFVPHTSSTARERHDWLCSNTGDEKAVFRSNRMLASSTLMLSTSCLFSSSMRCLSAGPTSIPIDDATDADAAAEMSSEGAAEGAAEALPESGKYEVCEGAGEVWDAATLGLLLGS